MAKKTREPTPEAEDEIFEVETVRDHRETVDEDGYINYEFLVHWKNYPDSDDTWEPRSSLMEGAKSILDAYIAKAARHGNVVPEDGARKKSKVAKLKADRPPSSKDSVKESSKRKKRESAAAEREAEEEEPPRKKKEKKAQAPVPVDIDSDEDLPAAPAPRKSLSKKEKVVAPPSPSPEPEPITAPAKKRKSTAGDKSRDFTDENVAPASTSKTSKKDKSNISVEIEKEKEEATASPGSVVFAREATWEHCIQALETLEQEEEGTGYRWYVQWNGGHGSEWIANKKARKMFPQRLITFYEDHLKFKAGPAEAADGDAEMQE